MNATVSASGVAGALENEGELADESHDEFELHGYGGELADASHDEIELHGYEGELADASHDELAFE